VGRILIVDDDLTQLTLRAALLESAGHQVRPAVSTRDTLRHVGQGWADLVILDLRMPEAIDGLALIRAIRESGCTIPILILSGWPDDLYGQPEEAMVSRILVKPALINDLLSSVSTLLGTA
jgi:CheY-like chemotaxis protein